MNPAEDIIRHFRKSTLRINRDRHEAIFAGILRAQEQSGESKPASSRPVDWSHIMRNPLTKLAVAAAVLIAGVIGLSLWRTTGSGIALAEVLARIEQIKAFQCKGSVAMAGEAAPGKSFQWETRYTCLTSQDYGVKVRVEEADPNGGLTPVGDTYFYPQKKTLILVGHAQKKYTRSELDDAEAQRMQGELGRYSDPGAFLREIMACQYESLGRSTLNAVEVEGFRTTDPNCRTGASGFKDPQVDVRVWIDVKSRLPVRYESLVIGLNERGSKTSFRFVMHDFRWDIPVDASEFDPPLAPAGYVMVEEKPGTQQ